MDSSEATEKLKKGENHDGSNFMNMTLTDNTGTIKTQYAYDPFGNATAIGEASDNPFQYTGRENDQPVLSGVEGGLYYYRARYYSPEMQRFISEDPIGIKGGINQFAYVENDPINYVDHEGKFKGRPSDIAKFLRCLRGLIKCAKDIEKLNKECQDECGQGQHGGSMYKCAVDKCWEDFEKCLKFALPGG